MERWRNIGKSLPELHKEIPPRNNRPFRDVACRFFDEENYKPKCVHIYMNGQYSKRSTMLVIDHRCQNLSVERLLSQKDKLSVATKLFRMDDKTEVFNVNELEHNMSLIAVGKNERLKLEQEYGVPFKNFVAAPVHPSDFGQAPPPRMYKAPRLPAISKSREELDDTSTRAPRSRSVPARPKRPSRPTSAHRPETAPAPAPKRNRTPSAPKRGQTPTRAAAPAKTPPKPAPASSRTSRDPTKKRPTAKPQKSQEAPPPDDTNQEEQPTEKSDDTKITERNDSPVDPVKPLPGEDSNAQNEGDDHKREDEAAAKIQAGFRGHQARKQVSVMRAASQAEKQEPPPEASAAEDAPPQEGEPPEDHSKEEEAATKIQAGFRGHQARKQVQAMKSVTHDDTQEAAEPEEKADEGGVEGEKEEDEEEQRRQAEAAVKIQANYRGYQGRKQVAAMKAEGQHDPEEGEAQPEEAGEEPAQPEAAAEDTAQPEEESPEGENNDEDLHKQEEAATKIQAGFRGHQARRQVHALKEEKVEHEKQDQAATKIQATFRGHQARKEVAAMKTNGEVAPEEGENGQEEGENPAAEEEEPPPAENHDDGGEEDEEVKKQAEAATKIQAGFRGHQARKEVAALKLANNEPQEAAADDAEAGK